MRSRFASLLVLSCCVAACGGDTLPPNEVVRERIEGLAPSANIGHRGTGPTREGHLLPENSISSFLAAMAEGADGIELDVEITQDGQLIVMHDDEVDRTTNCIGCVSELTLDEILACFLLDGAGQPTDAGLQVNVWTVNDEVEMEANIEKGVTGIITDEPQILADLLAN